MKFQIFVDKFHSANEFGAERLTKAR